MKKNHNPRSAVPKAKPVTRVETHPALLQNKTKTSLRKNMRTGANCRPDSAASEIKLLFSPAKAVLAKAQLQSIWPRLMLSGLRVGLLDVDIHGPIVPTMLGLEHETVQSSDRGLLPVELGNMKIMSIGFLLQNPDDAIIWRGPMKMGVIKQFLTDVEWGDLDYLIIDAPPGTGDEPLSLCQLIQPLDGAIIVTTPQRVAAIDVRKSISFCRRLSVPVLGVIENMSGFVCPKCGEITQILPAGSGKKIAADMKVPYLGTIPMDPAIAQSGDDGRAFIHHYASSPTAKLMQDIINQITDMDKTKN